MPGLTSSFLPDELNGLEDLKDDDVSVKITNDSVMNEDGPVLEPKGMLRRGQNEDDAPEVEEPETGDADAHNRRDFQREQRAQASRDRALKDLEEADRALLHSEKQKLQVQRDAFKMAKDNLDVRIRTSVEALKAAKAENDSSAATDIEQQLAEFRTLRTQVEHNEARLPHESQLDQAYTEHVTKRRASYAEMDAQDSGSRPLNDKAGGWAEKNASWFNRDQKAMATLHAINDSLAAEGYDPQKEEFFTELTRRMQKAHPTLGIKDSAGRAQPTRGSQAKGPPVAGARAAGTGVKNVDGKVNGKKVEVNVNLDDVRLMRKLGLDPANEKHKVRFARERGQRLLSEAQNG